MNRFLGPSGFYYGTKPDAALKKEKLIRQLRQRFPHLALFPHPAYWDPWLNPKHHLSTYGSPFFSPGLQFPYVMLKGRARQKVRRIRHPYGVFQLRPWRFDLPLFNMRLTKSMRQGHFHNVFHQKKHGREVHRKTGVRRREISDSQLALAMGQRNAKLKALLWAEAGGNVKGNQRLPPASAKQMAQNRSVDEKGSVDSLEDEETSVTLQPIKVKPGDSKLVVKPICGQSKSVTLKAGRSARLAATKKQSVINSTKDDIDSRRHERPSRKLKAAKSLVGPGMLGSSSSSEEVDSKEAEESSEQPFGGHNRTARDALEAIARRKEREKKLDRATLRRAAEQQAAEQAYLKNILNKSLKHPQPSEVQVLQRSQSQQRRAMHRTYLSQEQLTGEQQVGISKKHGRKAEHLERKSAKQAAENSNEAAKVAGVNDKKQEPFPYGNIPPKFQKTPGADDRFYWRQEGPKLRGHANRDKQNVFRSASQELLAAVGNSREDDKRIVTYERDDASPELRLTVPQKTKRANNGKAPTRASSRVASGASKMRLQPQEPEQYSRLLAPSPTALVPGAGSSVNSENSSRQVKGDLGIKESKNFSHSVNEKPTISGRTHKGHHGKKANKHRKSGCGPKIPAPQIEVPELQKAHIKSLMVQETFLKQRESLMKFRERAWKQALRKEAVRNEERLAKIKADQQEREAKVKKVTRNVSPSVLAKQPNRGNSHLSLQLKGLPNVPVSSTSRVSHRSLPVIIAENAVNHKTNRYFPKAKNRREAFRAYVAQHLLQLKAKLVFHYRLVHSMKNPEIDRWRRQTRNPEKPVFDAKHPYLVKIIKNLMKTKTGFRYKYESCAEEMQANFPFVEFQTYRKFPVIKMNKHDRLMHYMRIKKLYRGQRLFKMMTPVRWYKRITKNTLETPFDNQLYSDAVDEFQLLAQQQNLEEKSTDEAGEEYMQLGIYEVLCAHLKTAPVQQFQREVAWIIAGETTTINLADQNLTDVQVRPIAMCVMLSQLVDHLDISGNLLGIAGGRYIAGICGHTEHLSELNASNQHFFPDAVEILYRCLKRPYCKIKKLWLRNCGMGPESSQFIAGVLMDNRSITLLDVAQNHLGNVGNNDMFGLALVENHILEHLDLSNSGFSEKASHLIFMGAKASSSLQTFRFSHNHVGDRGAHAVSEMLKSVERLNFLDLEHTFITDYGAHQISKGIENNNSLITLILRDNPLGGDGSNAILRAVATQEVLKNVDLSVFFPTVAGAQKMVGEREIFIDHTGEKGPSSALLKYEIDMEALAAKKAKAAAAKKAKKK